MCKTVTLGILVSDERQGCEEESRIKVNSRPKSIMYRQL